MLLRTLTKQVTQTLRENSPLILTAIGVSGTITTAYLTGKASFEAERVIEQEERKRDKLIPRPPTMSVKDKAKFVWRFYIPATVSGVITIGCVIAGTRVGTKRAAAAYSLLSVSEKAFVEYKEKVVEQLGEKKEKTIRDEIAQDRITNNPPLVVIGNGTVLCHEMHTGRYFNCDMETLRKAENKINYKMRSDDVATLGDFYYLVGLQYTTYSGNMGWTVDKPLELRFSSAITEDQRPCITFEYNYLKPL